MSFQQLTDSFIIVVYWEKAYLGMWDFSVTVLRFASGANNNQVDFLQHIHVSVPPGALQTQTFF